MSNEEEILVPKLLPPSEDGIFKTLLTHPNAEPILRDIISEFLQFPVVNVEVRNVELPIKDTAAKQERFDVNCTADNGKMVNVEMQSEHMLGDNVVNSHVSLKNRTIFHLSDLHSSQPGRGISYQLLMHSYQITFCGFNVFPKRKDFINRFSFRNEDAEELIDSVGIIYVELSKLQPILRKPIENMSAIEMWSVFFAHGNETKYYSLLEDLKKAKEEIRLASDILGNISSDPDQRAKYLSRRKYQMDMDHERVETERLRTEAEQMAANAEKMTASAEQMAAEAARKIADADRMIADADRMIADADRKIADADRKIADADRMIADADRKIADADREADRKIADANRENTLKAILKGQKMGLSIEEIATFTSTPVSEIKEILDEANQ
jgi:predicted transposase/invertase (TIGR01784 family)